MPGRSPRSIVLWLVVAVQALCSTFFIWEILAGVFGLRSRAIAWELRELLEIGAAVGLLLGVGVGAVYLRSVIQRNRAMETQIRRASGAFAEFLEERLTEWGLTPSERDVAWFTIKGLSIAEIASMRKTSEGTVKAQSNAIYRKAGVSGRTQLLSLFLEDLMADDAPVRASAPRAPNAPARADEAV